MRVQTTVLVLGVLVLTGSGCAGMLEASRPASHLELGQRIRLKVPAARPPLQAGTLVALTSDSLVLRTAGPDQAEADTARHTFPLAAVKTVEESRGVRGHAFEGCVYGGQVGLIAVLLGFATGQWAPGDTESNVVFVGSMAAGAAIGAAVQSEDWRRVPSSALRVGIAPLPAGPLGISATLSLRR